MMMSIFEIQTRLNIILYNDYYLDLPFIFHDLVYWTTVLQMEDVYNTFDYSDHFPPFHC